MSDKSIYFKEFNRIYFEFLKFIKLHNKTTQYDVFYNKNFILKRMNIKIFIQLWYRRMAPYQDQIENGDVSFFLEKSFSEINDKEVTHHIHYFKELYIYMPSDHKSQFVEYVQQLTKHSIDYYKMINGS
jgi:hypothetical protein